VLSCLARALNKSHADLRIYDPYFCTGGIKRHLQAWGFVSLILFFLIKTIESHYYIIIDS
jgi:hypothetical protein